MIQQFTASMTSTRQKLFTQHFTWAKPLLYGHVTCPQLLVLVGIKQLWTPRGMAWICVLRSARPIAEVQRRVYFHDRYLLTDLCV